MSPRSHNGKRLKDARLMRKLTQTHVAEKEGINPNYYARIERDEVNPSLDVFLDIVRVLKVKSSDILPY